MHGPDTDAGGGGDGGGGHSVAAAGASAAFGRRRAASATSHAPASAAAASPPAVAPGAGGDQASELRHRRREPRMALRGVAQRLQRQIRILRLGSGAAEQHDRVRVVRVALLEVAHLLARLRLAHLQPRRRQLGHRVQVGRLHLQRRAERRRRLAPLLLRAERLAEEVVRVPALAHLERLLVVRDARRLVALHVRGDVAEEHQRLSLAVADDRLEEARRAGHVLGLGERARLGDDGRIGLGAGAEERQREEPRGRH